MSSQPSKRDYRNSLGFVEQGFYACWHNANDLVTAAKTLLANSLHAPALSLSVLALEELAKLYAIDGLLYARSDDHKATMFTKATRDHNIKLRIISFLPLLIGHISRSDPRFGKEQAYNISAAIAMEQLKADGKAVMARLQNDFTALNVCKQNGLYASPSDGGFVDPSTAIDPALAQLVYQLAWRATTTLDFALKNGNLERYIKSRTLKTSATSSLRNSTKNSNARRTNKPHSSSATTRARHDHGKGPSHTSPQPTTGTPDRIR